VPLGSVRSAAWRRVFRGKLAPNLRESTALRKPCQVQHWKCWGEVGEVLEGGWLTSDNRYYVKFRRGGQV
jgi:hypothetical protein